MVGVNEGKGGRKREEQGSQKVWINQSILFKKEEKLSREQLLSKFC
jgi:hypothetical protein